MDLDVFEKGKKIGILSNVSVDIGNGAANVFGTWVGILPFENVSDQIIPFELRGPGIYISNVKIISGVGDQLNQVIKLTGILEYQDRNRN
ncbi:MAG: hypothetical protein PHC61_04440 [Chitinivibrionales bacterium]|nr:hypothetical protein [Chitinivibrionales bacterium]